MGFLIWTATKTKTKTATRLATILLSDESHLIQFTRKALRCRRRSLPGATFAVDRHELDREQFLPHITDLARIIWRSFAACFPSLPWGRFDRFFHVFQVRFLSFWECGFRRLLPSLTAQKEKDCSAHEETLPAAQRKLSPFFHWVARICEVLCPYVKVLCYAYRPPL